MNIGSIVAALAGGLGTSSWGRPGPETRYFLDQSPNGIMVADLSAPDLPIVYANQTFSRITGYEPEEVRGRNCRFLHRDDRDQPALAEVRSAITERREVLALLRNYTKAGRMFWNELRLVPLMDRRGRVTHFLGILRDVTALRDATHRQEVAATIDRLTGTLNRYALVDHLNELAAERGRLLVANIDLAGFNLVNSGYGHEAGDALLVQVATRLRRLGAAAIGRVGSNEFTVAFRLDPGMSARKKLALLRGALAPRYDLPGVPAPVEVQIAKGFVVGEDGALDGTTLFRRAATALAEAKVSPLLETREFDRTIATAAKRRVRLTGEIQQSIANRDFVYHYQPKVELQTGVICGFEALLRWRRPNGMLMLPSEFLDVAEQNGLILDIGAATLPTAAAIAAELNRDRANVLPISINVSMTTFRLPNIIERVLDILGDVGTDPHHVVLELTEGVMAESTAEVIERFRQLRALGFGLSIDDFGTGYSNLRYLESFPVSEIKIDRSFIAGLAPGSRKIEIVDAVIRIGKALGATVVAEGVETQAEAAVLRDLGCDQAQGFLFGRPMPAAELLKLVNA